MSASMYNTVVTLYWTLAYTVLLLIFFVQMIHDIFASHNYQNAPCSSEMSNYGQ